MNSTRKFTSLHVIALLLGGGGLFLSRGIQTTGAFAYAFPIVSGAIFAVFLTAFFPRWVAAAATVAVAVIAIIHVRGVDNAQKTRWAQERLDYEMGDVCDGKALDREPTPGAKVRMMERFHNGKYWMGQSLGNGRIPAYILCMDHQSVAVSCGTYTESGGDHRSQRVCNSRDNVTIELRRTKTAEVVFTKFYAGADPQALGSMIQLGGPGSTRLSGDSVETKTMFDDIKPFLDKP